MFSVAVARESLNIWSLHALETLQIHNVPISIERYMIYSNSTNINSMIISMLMWLTTHTQTCPNFYNPNLGQKVLSLGDLKKQKQNGHKRSFGVGWTWNNK